LLGRGGTSGDAKEAVGTCQQQCDDERADQHDPGVAQRGRVPEGGGVQEGSPALDRISGFAVQAKR
jgi:hypothetical protein